MIALADMTCVQFVTGFLSPETFSNSDSDFN